MLYIEGVGGGCRNTQPHFYIHAKYYHYISKIHALMCPPTFQMSLMSLCLTFKSNDFAGWVHDGTVCRDGPADGRIWIAHVDDHHLGLFAHLLPDADELIRLHRERAKPNVRWVYAQVLEL